MEITLQFETPVPSAPRSFRCAYCDKMTAVWVSQAGWLACTKDKRSWDRKIREAEGKDAEMPNWIPPRSDPGSERNYRRVRQHGFSG